MRAARAEESPAVTCAMRACRGHRQNAGTRRVQKPRVQKRKAAAVLDEENNKVFEDALTHQAIGVFSDGFRIVRDAECGHKDTCPSLFFPGCSFLNFAPSLFEKTYELLCDAHIADGVSFLCCGKLLEFEPDAQTIIPAFEKQMVQTLGMRGVQRIVSACPNCTDILCSIIQRCAPESGIEVVPLPRALHDAGIAIDPACASAVLGEGAKVAVHDSCPDRKRGDFACNVRALLPEGMLSEAKHNQKRSFCCGSLQRAYGREDASRKASIIHGNEAIEAGAGCLLVYCMSCAAQLSHYQNIVSVHHYLELLFGCSIDWQSLPIYITTRFLFEESHGTRDYSGMSEGQ